MSVESTQAVTVIGSRVPIEFAKDIRRAAEAEDRSVSYFIRRALRNEVQRVGATPEPDRQTAA